MPRPIERLSTSSQASLYGVLHTHIDDVWPKVISFVEKALVYADGKYTSEYVYLSLKDRRMQLWVSLNPDVEACCVTEIIHFPSKCVANVFLVGGRNMDNWIHFEEMIETWARENGCQAIECYGRPGWEKVLGWERISTVLRKEL